MSFKDFSVSQTPPSKIAHDNKNEAGEKAGPPMNPTTAPAADPSAKPAEADPAPKS